MTEKHPPLKVFIGLIIGICIFFGAIIVVNEYTLLTGETLYLKSAPVDPRDLLRGDYVTLRYTFETDPLLSDFIIQNNIQENTTLYLIFEKDSENIGTLSGISQTPPSSGTFLKVQTAAQSWWRASIYTGIGKYFVPEGTGREIEKIRGDMLVETKLDTSGTAKIISLWYNRTIINPKTFQAPLQK